MQNKFELATCYTTEYIDAVFEPSLRDAGFVCPDHDHLCWYRLRSSEIVNSIIFFSRWATPPLFVEIGYGIFPSFEQPIRINHAVYNDNPEEELFVSRSIVENWPNGGAKAPFSDGIPVYAPLQGGRGIYTFEQLLLPNMDQIVTIREAYDYHKRRRAYHPLAHRRSPDSHLGDLSKIFIDMALWVDDYDIYPYAIQQIDKKYALYQKLCKKYPNRKNYARELANWRRLNEVFMSGDRSSYLMELSQKMDENAKNLKQLYFSN